MANSHGRVLQTGWVVAAVGPLVAVAAQWEHVMPGHSAIKVVILAGYEVLLAVVGFTRGVASELRKRWQQRAVEHVDQALVRRISSFNSLYRDFMLADLRFIDIKGLATIGFYTPELDEVFVDVGLAYRAPNQVSSGVLAELPADVTDRHSIVEFIGNAQPAVLAVIGAPGSGKTTLLRHTAREICRARRKVRRFVPVLLYLRDHAAAIVAAPSIALPELVRRTLDGLGSSEPTGWFEQHFREGNCVVLLDGLDEVAQQEDRRTVIDWVESQIRQHPGNDYVITSRPQGYRSAPLSGAAVLQVRSFTGGQVNRFVRSWYEAVEKHSTGTDGTDLRLRVDSAAEDLLERLNGAPALYDLTINPLLLTMIANVHRFRGALPGSRVELYSEICQVMLWRRQEAKKLPVELGGEKKETILRKLALAMMQRRVRDLPKDDVLAEIRPTLRRLSREITSEDFLADVSSNGLFVERETGVYAFAHHTFQEYLAAARIRDDGNSNLLVESVDDLWWRETALLYAARSDADEIVRACLNSGTSAALSLAFDCSDQGSELAPELRDRLNHLLRSSYAPDTNPEHRRLIAGVLVTRYLNRPIQAEGGGRVCAPPISTKLYWLYQKDTGQVDGVTKAEPDSNQPMVGVLGTDASAFAYWVNSITDSDVAYRLPTKQEIEDASVQRALNILPNGIPSRGVWLEPEPGHHYPTLWIPAGSTHPHEIDAQTLEDRIRYETGRSAATLSLLLILRSVAILRILAHALNRIGAIDSVHVRMVDCILDRAVAHDIARDINAAHAPEYILARNLAIDHVVISVSELDPDVSLDHDITLTRDLVRARILLLARDLVVAKELAGRITMDLDSDLALVRDFARNVAHAVANDLANDLGIGGDRDREVVEILARNRARNRALDRTLDRALDRVMGVALSRVLSHMSRRDALYKNGPSVENWTAAFWRGLSNETKIAEAGGIVPLDVLTNEIRDQFGCFISSLVTQGRPDTESWAYQMARRLEAEVVPTLTKAVPATADTVKSTLLQALCLAAEADARDLHWFGSTLREVAAGITLFEQRLSGQALFTEMIVLATT